MGGFVVNKMSIEMKDICKSFGELKANHNVNIKVNSGEVHAILGENGAGKSTLMNMLSGIYSPDSGFIFVDKKEVRFASPKDSIKLGIGMIHQHFKLVDVLTAKENILMGNAKGEKKGKELDKEIKQLTEKYGLDINPRKKVYEMSVGEKQTLEIIKVLHRGARILILDEPTAVLTPQEIKKLFKIIRAMRDDGCIIMIITHKLNEVMEISDRITVLRRGESVATINTNEADISDLIEHMVGARTDLEITREISKEKKEMMVIDDLTVVDGEGKEALKNLTITLMGGEILGVAGVANSGQKELCETIAGLMQANKGRIFFEGDNILGKSPRDIIKLGIRMGFIPEDRLGMGLIGTMDIVHNLILKDYQNQKGIFLKRDECTQKAEHIVDYLDIKTPSIYTMVKQLSGGNIQKVLLGREIDANPKVLITAYPVRGLDVGASYKIYDLLNEQKKKGVAVLFIGEDLDVLLDLCDKIMVLCNGEVTGIVDPTQVTKEDIGLLMAGGQLGGANV